MSTDTKPMSPAATSGDITKRAGVRRVNNMPVYIVGALLSTFLLAMVWVAADRATQHNRSVQTKNEKIGNASLFAREIAGDRQDGIIPPQATAPLAIPDWSVSPDNANVAAITMPNDLDALPLTPTPLPNPPQYETRNDEGDRIRIVKLQQLEEAVKAKTAIQFSLPHRWAPNTTSSSASTPQDDILSRLAAVRQQIHASNERDDPTAAYKARLQQIQAAAEAEKDDSGGNLAKPIFLRAPAAGHDHNTGQFSYTEDRWKLDSQLNSPRSPYELRAGFVIPATLISGIRSDLPGQILAQVNQDVFDTATGKWRLIPQGSRLLGSYSNDVAYGQARVLIAWQRIIFPDGKAMDIGSMPGADSAGYAGFADQSNQHYARLFASASLMSGVAAGIALSQPQTASGKPTSQTTSSAMSEALGQQLGQVTAQLIAKNMNIAPTLEIRPG